MWTPSRVLICSGNSPDYGVDGLADGMLRWLGPDHVRVHLHYPSGYLTPSLRSLQPFYDWVEHATWTWSPSEADLVILSCRSPEWLPSFCRMNFTCPIALVDSNDTPTIEPNGLPSTLIFKRELYAYPLPDHPTVRPLPVTVFSSQPVGTQPFLYRQIKACFIGAICHSDPPHPHCESRLGICRLLQQRPGSLTLLNANLDDEAYAQLLSTSRVGLSCYGAYGASDSFRYWEIPYFGGLLMSLPPVHVIPENFTHQQNALFFKTVEELAGCLEWVEAHPEDAEAMAKAGQHHLLTHHLTLHRAQYVVRELADYLGLHDAQSP